MNLAGETVAEPGAELGDASAEIALGLAALARDDLEAAHGERGREQEAGHIGRGAGHHRHHQGAQAEGARLRQRGGGEGPLDIVGDGRASASRS